MGAQPIFMTQKSGTWRFDNGVLLGTQDTQFSGDIEFNGVDEYTLLRRINEVTLEVCDEKKLTCFDLANELDLEGDDFYDYEHTSPKGSEKIGHYLFKKLEPILMTENG